uniref:Cystatin domain-containing protein n=1 Tax=Romanomermis culicivorax TaxID=13658 RepID=A0A915IY73_ROMCU
MLRLVLPVLICIDSARAFCLQPNRRGALPSLSVQASNGPMMGGISAYDLSKCDKYSDLQHLVQVAIDNVQVKEQANKTLSKQVPFKFHKLINIKEATFQVVNGLSYQVIFSVVERDCNPKKDEDDDDDDFGASKYVCCDNSAVLYQGCHAKKGGQRGNCYFKILSQPSTGLLTVKEYTCVECDSPEVA